MFVKLSAVKLEASCLGALSLRLLCYSSNTFTAHLVLCCVFLEPCYPKEDVLPPLFSVAETGARPCLPPCRQSQSKCTTANVFVNLKKSLPENNINIQYPMTTLTNLNTNIQKFPKQHPISLESTRQCQVCCMHACVTQWRYYYKVFISQVVYNIRGVLYGPQQSLAFGSRL